MAISRGGARDGAGGGDGAAASGLRLEVSYAADVSRFELPSGAWHPQRGWEVALGAWRPAAPMARGRANAGDVSLINVSLD